MWSKEKPEKGVLAAHIGAGGEQGCGAQGLVHDGVQEGVRVADEARVQEAVARGPHEEGVAPRQRRLPA